MWLNCLIVLNKGVQTQTERLAYENATKCAAAWAPARPGGPAHRAAPAQLSRAGRPALKEPSRARGARAVPAARPSLRPQEAAA